MKEIQPFYAGSKSMLFDMLDIYDHLDFITTTRMG